MLTYIELFAMLSITNTNADGEGRDVSELVATTSTLEVAGARLMSFILRQFCCVQHELFFSFIKKNGLVK